MDIEDMQDDWDDQMVEINNKLYDKAVEVGISKAEYLHQYKFKVFKITDMKRDRGYNRLSKSHAAIDTNICTERECKFQPKHPKHPTTGFRDTERRKLNQKIIATGKKEGQTLNLQSNNRSFGKAA